MHSSSLVEDRDPMIPTMDMQDMQVMEEETITRWGSMASKCLVTEVTTVNMGMGVIMGAIMGVIR